MVSRTASAAAALAAAALMGAHTANAEVQPQPAPPTPPIAAPVDTPYPGGVIKLNVDATDLAHAIMTVHEVVPVAGPGR